MDDDPPPPPPTWLPQRQPDQGAMLLRDYPGEVVRLDCICCPRVGRYRLATLVERFGPAAGLRDVLAALSADCPRWRDWRQRGGPCGAGFPELAARSKVQADARPEDHEPGAEFFRCGSYR